VKLAFTIEAIWQAATYRRFSHFVYLTCFESDKAMRDESQGRLLNECAELGIGVLSLRKAGAGGAGSACTQIISPRRHNPSAVELDAFLDAHQSELRLTSPFRQVRR
jgi:hypothetical protein